METEIMELPKCPTHGQMLIREQHRQSTEQKWCGTWYDCPQCSNSTLLPSKELLTFLKEQNNG